VSNEYSEGKHRWNFGFFLLKLWKPANLSRRSFSDELPSWYSRYFRFKYRFSLYGLQSNRLREGLIYSCNCLDHMP
jgi:hypothetical protein